MLKIQDGQLTYQLSISEKLGAFHGSPTARIENLVSVSKEENPWSTKVLRGFRAPGTGFPYLIMLGTMRHRKGKDFCVVYKKKPVLLLEFENENFKRWVIPDKTENVAVLSEIGK
ncbi:MAG: hypothetical protein FGM47_01040 [Candidatus Nanopelagicaceae bacterium]|nr:hypothetical protein [Candidatus Nanopelagicaceae bacterium]